MLKQCTAVEIRQNLEMVNNLAKLGLDFVAIPVFSEEEKLKFLKIADEQLEKCCLLAKQE